VVLGGQCAEPGGPRGIGGFLGRRSSYTSRTMRSQACFPTTVRPKEKLLVFARVPQRGRVKSRIARELGEERTLQLYQAMLADLLDSVGDSSSHSEVEILWTADGEVGGDELRKWFGDRELSTQTGRDLGERLVTAFSERILFDKTEKVIAIGTDAPTLGREEIELAFQLLDSCDWVLGPAMDGGYYLIGCREEAFFTRAFEEIEWGSSTVFEATRERLRTRNRTVAILPVRNDLDEMSDLRSFGASRESAQARRLHRLLTAWRIG